MWWPTVLAEIPSRAATCLLASPRAIRRNTSTSRSVNPAGRDRRCTLTGVAGRRQHRVHFDPAQPALVNLLQQLRGGVGWAAGRPVGAVLDHRVVGVGGRQQPSRQVELVTAEPTVVPAAVASFVVAASQRRVRCEQSAA